MLRIFDSITRSESLVCKRVLYPILLIAICPATVSAASPDSTDLRFELGRHSFTPHMLAASGVTSGQAESVLLYAIDSIEDHWDAVDAARSSHDALRTQLNQLAEIVRSGQASSSQVADYAQLQDQVASARTALDSATLTMDQAMLASLNAEQHQQFQLLRQNSGHQVGMEYGLLELSSDEWTELHSALSAIESFEDIQEEGDNPPPAAATQTVQQYETSYYVNLVRTRLSTHAAEIAGRFETVLMNQP